MTREQKGWYKVRIEKDKVPFVPVRVVLETEEELKKFMGTLTEAEFRMTRYLPGSPKTFAMELYYKIKDFLRE